MFYKYIKNSTLFTSLQKQNTLFSFYATKYNSLILKTPVYYYIFLANQPVFSPFLFFDPFKILTENIYLVLILKPYAAAHCIAVRSEIIGGTVDCFQLILRLAAIGIVKAKLLTFLYQSFFLWHCCRLGNRCNCRHCLRRDSRKSFRCNCRNRLLSISNC